MSPLRSLAMILAGVAAAIVIVAVAILPFLTPAWVGFEQGRAEAQAWTGYSAADLRTATDAILADLVLGPPAFVVEVAGAPVLNERERGHMRDVRVVFGALAIAALVSAVILAVEAIRVRDRVALWRAVKGGAIGLSVAIVALGVVAVVAFETLFEVFHEALFPAGSFDFDPATERLVQLFPFRFWQESAIAVGVVIVAASVVVAVVAHRRAARPSAEPTAHAPGTRVAEAR